MPIHSINSVEELARIIAVQQEIATSTLGLDELMDLICARTLSLVPGHGTAVELVDGDDMVFRAVAGRAAAQMRGFRLKIRGSLSGLSLVNNEVSRCDDTETDPRVDRAGSRRLNVRSMICVPLGPSGRPIGVLKVFSDQPHAYGDRDVNLLRLVAGLMSATLGHAHEAELKEAALRSASASEQTLRRLVDTAFEAVVVSRNGFITDTNPRFLDMFGRTKDEVIGGRIADVVAARDEALVADRVANNIEGAYEFCGQRADGTEFPVEGRGTTLFHGGEAIRISTMRDVTERKRTEESLRRSQQDSLEAARLKSEFMANMSHEIRTPLNGVMGLADLLAGTDLNEEQREYTRLIRTSADTLLKLVSDILDFSKLEANKVSLESLPIELAILINEVTLPLVTPALAKGVDLRVEIDGEWPTLSGDPTRLRQVLANLVTNALKFTAAGHVIVRVRSLKASAGHRRVMFEIEDTGIGIPERALDRMFKPFSQVDASMSRRFGGTGLGLSISRQLVERMGGEIGVRSAENLGSTFWFKLDLAVSRSAPAVIAPAPSDAIALDRDLRVLVAEDNAINQLIAIKMIERMGVTPQAVPNGRAALERVRRERFDLILMDCQMPEMDGFEATRRIRAEFGDAVVIVAMTANAMPEDRERCLNAGMNDYIAKPIDYPGLREIVGRWARARGPSVKLSDGGEGVVRGPELG